MRFTGIVRPVGLVASVVLASCAGLPATGNAHDAGAAADTSSELSVKAPEVDALVDSYIKDGHLPLLYVRVEDSSGATIYEHQASNPDLSGGAEVSGDSWFRIWSMSKIVTISAALDMIEDGLIAFDTPVADYIPEFADLVVAVDQNGETLAKRSSESFVDPAIKTELENLDCPLDSVTIARPITVRDLLNHQAGFYYSTTQVPCLDEVIAKADVAQSRSSKELIDKLASLPLIQQPGSVYYYGMNTSVLGLMLERVEGKSLPEIIKARITGPLGIENLRYALPEGETLYPHVTGKDGALAVTNPATLDIYGSVPQLYDPQSELYLGGEGMVATTEAYADFLQMLLGRGKSGDVRILNEMTIEALTTPKTMFDSEWGMNGWNLWLNSGKMASGEDGVGGLWIGGGYEGTHFWVDTKRGLLGLIMTQVHSPPPEANLAQDNIREAIYANLSGAAR